MPAKNPDAERCESALFALARDPQTLAALFRAALGPALLAEQASHLARRRANESSEDALAHAFLENKRARKSLVAAVLGCLPACELPAGDWDAEGLLPHIRPTTVRAALRASLLACDGEEESTTDALAEQLQAWEPWLGEPPAEQVGASRRPTPKPPPRRAQRPSPSAEKDLAEKKRQLKLAEKRANDLGQQCSDVSKRLEKEKANHEKAKAQVKFEKRRSTQLKQQLRAARSPSDRLQKAEGQARDARHDLVVLERKFELIQAEVDDLRGVLEDMDLYLAQPEEAVESFRGRPLPAQEQALAETLEGRGIAGAGPFRILVVGGGEPQYRHKDKFREYAALLHFEGKWRMANYTSWQNEMKRLKREMRDRFDAMVILHWNRTTFTKNARRICNDEGQRPCVTCHYEGFVSLRKALQETLRQLLAAESR